MQRTEPWITEEANKILENYMNTHKNLSVFEFGMGASTLWFLKQKNIANFVSVEHDENYYNEIINQKPKNHTSSIFMLKPMPYNNCIDRFGLFDIIFVDGRNRSKCIESSISHLKPNALLILDNSEREYYLPGIEKLISSGISKVIHTHQPENDKYGFTYPGWRTSFYFKGIIKDI